MRPFLYLSLFPWLGCRTEISWPGGTGVRNPGTTKGQLARGGDIDIDRAVGVLEHIRIDPGLLVNRTNGAAIEFAADETDLFQLLVARLLEMLQSSDFAIAFPKHPVLITLHHHKQLLYAESYLRPMPVIFYLILLHWF